MPPFLKSSRLWLATGSLAGVVAVVSLVGVSSPQEKAPGPATEASAQAPVKPLEDKHPTIAAAEKTEESQPEVIAETPKTWSDAPLSPSLEGTEIDGRLRADASGHLIVDLETKDFFDYMLSAVGQVTPEQALDAIATMARNNLPPEAADEAVALLDRYLEYKREALAMGQTRLDPSRQNDPAYQLSQLRQALADLKSLRRSTLSPETADAFFGLEEAYGEYTIATMEIQQRDDLSPEARKALMQWQRQQLPDVIRHTENRLIEENEVSNTRQQALAEATTPQQAAEKLRNLGMDPAQAQEVEGYLQERQSFDQQFDNYKQELDQLQAAGLAPDDEEKREAALLARYFPDEQTRTWARLRQLD